MVVARLAEPKSKMGTVEWLKEEEMAEVNLDRLYRRMMDRLHERIDRVKAVVLQKTLESLDGKVRVMLFDVTTLCQRQCLLAGDKYEKLKEGIKNLFEAKGRRYGYGRIHALLVREEIGVFGKSHQAVHGKCFLIVFGRKGRRYSAYQGEKTPAARNLLKQD